MNMRMRLKGIVVNLYRARSQKRIYVVVSSIVMFFCFANAWAEKPYGELLCHNPGYHCVTVERGDSWAQLFTNDYQRDLVKRVNRMNVFLKPDMVIAVPNDLDKKIPADLSPFPFEVPSVGEKMVKVSLKEFAWAAYDKDGQQVKWGPISIGIGNCPDVKEGCATPLGTFRVIRKQGESCVSSAFPKRVDGQSGGAAMPYCMHFYKGYALHASDELTGTSSTHGCVNLFKVDAQWLNQEFVETPSKERKGTLVVIM